METHPESLFPAHLATVARLATAALEAAGFDGLLVPAGEPPVQFADDQPYPFKPNPYFRLWVPEATPGSLLVFEPGRRPLLLFRQEADYWNMPPQTPTGAWTAEFELVVVADAAQARAALPPGRRWALLGEPAEAWQGLGEANPGRLKAFLDYHRASKTPYEVACLAAASVRPGSSK